MEYRKLGASGLMVPAITLGTFNFGGIGPFARLGTLDLPAARRLCDMARDHGAFLFDTANMYSTGIAEEMLAEALGEARGDVLISSKARMKMGPGPNDEGASRLHLIRACEDSLRRLKRDHIDIYYIHEWDGATPVDETMAALDRLTQDGKIRYAGCSNYAGWHVMKSQAAADRAGGARFVTQQIHYTIEAREAEYELLPISVDQGMGVLVWSPLAGGLLTGKHRRDLPVAPGTRQEAGWTEPPIRDAGRLWDIVEALADVGAAHGVSAAQVALAWLLTRPAISSLVVGARTPEQFADNLAAVSLKLTEADLSRLNALSKPPLIYPYWHQGQFARARFTPADWALHEGNEPAAW